MIKLPLFPIILLIFLPATGLHSQALFQGLNQPIDARGWSMGAAISSQFKGASGMLYNPAVIARAPDLWQLNYTSFPLDIASSSAFAIFHTPLKGKFGLLLNYLNYGSFTERDTDGNEIGSFSVNDLTFRLSYGLQLTRRLSIGLASGYAHSQLSSLSARALLGTIGIHYYDNISTLSIGISYHNFGTLIEGYANNNESLPSTFIIGVSKKLEHLPMIISIDGYQAHADEYVAKIGGEFIISDHFFLRWGTSTRRFQIRGQETFRNFFASTSTGAGIYFGSFFIDMAFVGLGDAGVISSFSITQHL